MTTMEIARKLADLGQTADAQKAYELAMNQADLTPAEELEAAGYIFYSQGDYRISFTHFVSLYNRGQFQTEIFDIMLQAFYLPNVEPMQKQYRKNIKALEKYPYLFRKDFPKMEDSPIYFFPFDDNGFVPFYVKENRFGDYVNFNDPVIDRWFFKDLSKPILADDVFSQYQLEYLNDNVRKSEWVAMENHIYLHYADWAVFCAYLQVLDFKNLLMDEKLVFLIGEEVRRYPIDFKAEYGIDYSRFEVKPVGIREVKRLIWHTQLATHNGGDFFNEIFYGHPNLIVVDSLLMDNVTESVNQSYRDAKRERKTNIGQMLGKIKNPTKKDALVALYMADEYLSSKPDPNARIAPALFFQPHFYNLTCSVYQPDEEKKDVILYSKQYEESIRNNPIFAEFPYIKTFTPMRRPTTSYAATVRFVVDCPVTKKEKLKENEISVSDDMIQNRLANRTFMVDPWDRLYHDSRLVRFEDGKLNPKATFTALAEFLDIPYTQSMTYCSGAKGINPESLQGNDLGFSTAAIYRTYDEYANDDERAFIEYFFRDAYEAYGYDFHYYKGEPVDMDWVKNKINNFTTVNTHIRNFWVKAQELQGSDDVDGESFIAVGEKFMAQYIRGRLQFAEKQLKGIRFVNPQGQPLQLMTPLKLDPALLEQPLYR